jgi:hypothetical protein
VTIDTLMRGPFLESDEAGIVADDSMEIVDVDVDGRNVKAEEAEIDRSSLF